MKRDSMYNPLKALAMTAGMAAILLFSRALPAAVAAPGQEVRKEAKSSESTEATRHEEPRSEKKKPWYKKRVTKYTAGGAGAGAIAGGLIGGGKGAVAGAVVGGGGGYVLHRRTRNR